MTQRDLRIDLTINGSMVKRERDNSLLDLSQIFQDKFFWNHLETIYCDIRKNCKFACFPEALHATRARFCSWKSFSFWLKGADDKILKQGKPTCRVISGLGRAIADLLIELSADRGNFCPITIENDSFRLSWNAKEVDHVAPVRF